MSDTVRFNRRDRTRALKRRRTYEPRPDPEDADSSFTAESDSDESSDHRGPGKGKARKQKKAEKKAEKPKADPQVKKNKAEATKQISKVAKVLDGLRQECRSEWLLEVEIAVVEPVRKAISVLSKLEKGLQGANDTGVDSGIVEQAKKFDYQECMADKNKLKKALGKLGKR